MLYAAYYRAELMSSCKMPVGLYASIDQAKKACIRAAKRLESVTIRTADFKWKVFMDDFCNLTMAEACVGVGQCGFIFYVCRVGE